MGNRANAKDSAAEQASHATALTECLGGSYDVPRAEALRGLVMQHPRNLLQDLGDQGPMALGVLSERLITAADIVGFSYLVKAGLIQAGEHKLHITDAGRRALKVLPLVLEHSRERHGAVSGSRNS